jgi:PAS domain S-box-containing protein
MRPDRAHSEFVAIVGRQVDAPDHQHTEQHLRQLASIIESSYDAIIGKTLDGIITSWNRGAKRLFGYTADEIIGKSGAILVPMDRADEEPDILQRIYRGEHVEHYETVRRRKDGSLVEISLTVSPINDATGSIIGASKIARDISGRKRAEDQRQLLMRELNHRVKNLFAVTNAVVALSARSARTPKDLANAIRGRLDALTRAHELILPDLIEPHENADHTTTLGALVGVIFSPYLDGVDDENPNCVRIDGPAMPIGGNVVTSLALALHELATNAAKYGALSLSSGHVDITWSVVGDDVLMVWVERGGPPVDHPPRSEKFGGSLVRRCIIDQLGGQITHHWPPAGLVVNISVPRARLQGS